MDRTRVHMLEAHDSLDKGGQFNLPKELARSLIESGKAKAVHTAEPQETKPAGPSETKVVAPKETKGKKK